MNTLIYAAAALGSIILLIILLRFFLSPIKLIFKLLLNTALGFAGLIVIDHLGKYIGISIGINLLNAVVVGVLGIPGLGLLFLLKWLFVI